ncbi:MAG: cell division protein ZapA [Bacteroidetes bacterium]|nr:cell division protein ZapA [Bacteroidota bacterium]
MEEISIKVSIANREYPLKIKKADEARVLKAANLINERIKEYEQQYAVSDKLDLLAMCVMQFATEFIHLSEDIPIERQSVEDSISALNSRISEYLNVKSVL